MAKNKRHKQSNKQQKQADTNQLVQNADADTITNIEIDSNSEENIVIAATPIHRQRKQKSRVFVTIMLFFVALIMVCGLLVVGYVISLRSELPDISSTDLLNAQTSFVYDNSGDLVAALHGGENRVSVELEEMPDFLIDALIASEDIRFYEHDGVDVRSIFRAVVVDVMDSLRAGQVTFSQGASTITMQLVKNVIGEDEKKISRKIKEALLAMKLEEEYEKDDILYYYMNEIYLGPSVYGVQAASKYYFDKDVADISITEAATLVAILRSPGYYDPYKEPERVINVRNAVLNSMAIYNEELYGESARAAKAEPLAVYYSTGDYSVYEHPWFVDYVIDEAVGIVSGLGYDSSYVYTGGLYIYTTLDTNVQSAMETVYADDSNFPTSSTGDLVESGMAVVDSETGAIRGLVGGRVYTTRRGFNRASDIQRSPGSSIKPIVAYGPAIAEGYGAGTIIYDAPVTYGSWSPKNDDGGYSGHITMRTAIALSRNICAVKTLEAIGTQTGYSYATRMGLKLDPSDAYNLSLALGGTKYGVSPLDMAGAFATFASGGVHTDPYCITRIEDSRGNVIYSANPEQDQVFTASEAYIITSMLTSAVSYGTGTNAKVSGWQTAGKTGTNGLPSDDPDYAGRSGNIDAWFCGYTTALSGAVWIGYDNKWDDDGNLQYLRNIYGGSYPAKIFSKVMTIALSNYDNNREFAWPSGIVYRVANGATGATSEADYGSGDMWTSSGTLGLIGEPIQMISIQICTQSGQLATKYCPSTTTLEVEEGESVSGYCTLHGDGTSGPDDPSDWEDPDGDHGWDDPEEYWQQIIDELF